MAWCTGGSKSNAAMYTSDINSQLADNKGWTQVECGSPRTGAATGVPITTSAGYTTDVVYNDYTSVGGSQAFGGVVTQTAPLSIREPPSGAVGGGVTYNTYRGDFNGDGVQDTLILSQGPGAQPIGDLGTHAPGSAGCKAVSQGTRKIRMRVPVQERVKVDRMRQTKVTSIVPECKTIMVKEPRVRREEYTEQVPVTKMERYPVQIKVTQMVTRKRPKKITTQRMVQEIRTVPIKVPETHTEFDEQTFYTTEMRNEQINEPVQTSVPCRVRVPKYKAIVVSRHQQGSAYGSRQGRQ